MKILVDVMGADKPENIIIGALEAEIPASYMVVLYGDKDLIENTARSVKAKVKYEIVATDEVISNNESPTLEFRTKKNSSMRRAFEDLNKVDAAGLVSAGSTGAVLTGGTLMTGRINGIMRPTLCPVLPTLDGSCCLVADAGANVDAKPEWLVQFALMASIYYTAVYGKENPRVALLNIGAEEHKGNNLTHTVYPLLLEAGINFIGNVEAREAFSGYCDIVIADGFDGNVLVKSTEGAVAMVLKLLKNAISESFSAKMGALLMKGAFKKLKKSMDINNYGGAPLLGVKKAIVKTHGASKPGSVTESVKEIVSMFESGVIKTIDGVINGQQNG